MDKEPEAAALDSSTYEQEPWKQSDNEKEELKLNLRFLRDTPVFRVILAILALILMMLFLIWELGTLSTMLPSASRLNNLLLLILCCLLALFSGSISTAVLWNGFQKKEWSRHSAFTYYGGILMGLVFFLTGIQLLLFGEFKSTNYLIYFALKITKIALLILFVGVALIFEWKDKLEKRHQKPEDSETVS